MVSKILKVITELVCRNIFCLHLYLLSIRIRDGRNRI